LSIAATAASASIAAAAAAAAAIASAAAVASAVATMMASMATTAAAMMTSMASAAAAAATAAAAVTTTTITTTAHSAKNKGRSLVFTAHQGDSNQREKHRESKNNNSVHPRILQLLTGTVSGNYQVAVLKGSQRDSRRLSAAMRPSRCERFTLAPEAVPVVKIYGLRKM
jgi:predicted metal-binding membrane protein